MESPRTERSRDFVDTQSAIKLCAVRHSLRTSPLCLRWILGRLDRAPDLALSLTPFESETNRSIALYQTWNRRSSPYRGSQTYLPERASVLAYLFNKASLGLHFGPPHLRLTLTVKKEKGIFLSRIRYVGHVLPFKPLTCCPCPKIWYFDPGGFAFETYLPEY